MQDFDVVIIGAGPAGGQCARILAEAGRKILLVEQHENFYRNNFSSAATVLETLRQFDLPDAVVGGYWRKLAIIATATAGHWQAPSPVGAVLDFAGLREFLVRTSAANGGVIWMGHRYVSHTRTNGKTVVRIKSKEGKTITVGTTVLVDATGFSRAVIYSDKKDKPVFLRGKGIEYLLEVEDRVYQDYAGTLVFFMGHKWSPKGYSWIFPMAGNQLKVGAACYDETHKLIRQAKPLRESVHSIIENHMGLNSYTIIDRHGSILEYSSGLNDIYSRDNIIVIGDAVSTVNFLGGEGIRHGLLGAVIACRYIQDYLDRRIQDFRGYKIEMRRIFSKKWNVSERIGRRVYLEYSDRKINQGVNRLQHLSMTDMIDILFHYKFETYPKYLTGYLKLKWSGFIKAFRQKRK